jgi:hypothetical protein
MQAASNPIPGLRRNHGQQVWRYKEQLRLYRKAPCGTLRPPLDLISAQFIRALSTAVVFPKIHCIDKVKPRQASEMACIFSWSFRGRKSAPHNGRIGSAFEAMPFLQGAGTGSASGDAPPARAQRSMKMAPFGSRAKSGRPSRGGQVGEAKSERKSDTMCIDGQRSPFCAVILSQRFVLTRQRRDPKETPLKAPYGHHGRRQLRRHRVARAIQISSAVRLPFSRRPISSMC